MTNAEEKQIQYLNQTLNAIREENKKFKDQMTELITAMNNKVEAKHAPITLEQSILAKVQSAMDAAIGETLKGYNSPLTLLIKQVVESRNTQLKDVITTAFDEVITVAEFKQSIVHAFSHKVAKTIISNNDGLFDKVSNDLKQDAVFKSKMTVAVSNVVNECINANN